MKRFYLKINIFRLFLWTIEGLAKSGKWQQLETFGRSRKSPVGYLVNFYIISINDNFSL